MMRFRVLSISVLLLGAAAPAYAATHRVPSEYATINNALDVSAFGDTVLVAPGTYTDWENRPGPGNGVSAAAFMVDGVALRSEGGSSVTSLDMQGEGIGDSDVIRAEDLPSEMTLIEGFTIQGVPLDGSALVAAHCGKVTVRDCRVFDVGTQAPGTGAHALRSRYTDIEVSDCWFENCSASGGGAIGNLGGSTVISNCDFRFCSFNAVLLNGDGGIFPTAEVLDSRFVGNLSGGGAAALQLTNCTGGGIVTRCRFENNVSNGTSGAGTAIWINNDSRPATVADCVFVNNQLLGVGGGASLHVGLLGGVVTIARNTFYGSQAENIYTGSAVDLTGPMQVTFANNIIASSSPGPAVLVLNGTMMSTSCNVFWDNPGGETYGFPLSPTDRVIDPEFCDPKNGDVSLSPLSPCLPANSLGCGLIGALGEGCGVVSIAPESWGSIKSKYR